MKVKFQYANRVMWEGSPEEAHKSPDPRPPEGGVIRMYAIDDEGRETVFVYDDFYYLYPTEGGWLFGSGTPKREFIFREGKQPEAIEAFHLPESAVVRYGVLLDNDEARSFGLITKSGKLLTPIRDTIVVERG